VKGEVRGRSIGVRERGVGGRGTRVKDNLQCYTFNLPDFIGYVVDFESFISADV
jgi:hypothetical protein